MTEEKDVNAANLRLGRIDNAGSAREKGKKIVSVTESATPTVSTRVANTRGTARSKELF